MKGPVIECAGRIPPADSSIRKGMERPPIACTLNVADFVERSELWRQVIEGWGIKRERTSDGIHLTFRRDSGVAATLEELARLEAECCPWMRIAISERQQIHMRLSADDPAGAKMLATLFEVA